MVALLVVIFLVIEHLLYIIFCRKVNADILAVGAGLQALKGEEDKGATTSWMDWTMQLASNDSPSMRRQVYVDDLMHRIETNSTVLWIHRMGIMAPLLGLLVTIVAFLMFKVPTADDGGASAIITSLRPLMLGVGAGALLAIVNQVYQQLCSNKSEELIGLSKRWLDGFLHEQSGEAALPATDFTSVLRRFDDLIDGFKGALPSEPATDQLAELIQPSLTGLNRSVQEIGAAVRSLKDGIAAVKSTLDEQDETGRLLSANIEKSLSSRLDKFVDVDRGMNAAAAALGQSSASSERSSQELAKTTQAYMHIGKSLEESIKAIEPSMQRFSRSSELLEVSIEQASAFSDEMDQAIQDLGSVGGTFKPMTASYMASLDTLNSVQEQLLNAAEGTSKDLTKWTEKVEGYLESMDVQHSESIERLEGATSHLGQRLGELTEMFEGIHDEMSKVADLMEKTSVRKRGKFRIFGRNS